MEPSEAIASRRRFRRSFSPRDQPLSPLRVARVIPDMITSIPPCKPQNDTICVNCQIVVTSSFLRCVIEAFVTPTSAIN